MEFEDTDDEYDTDPPWISQFQVQDMHEIPYHPDDELKAHLLSESEQREPIPEGDVREAEPNEEPPALGG